MHRGIWVTAAALGIALGVLAAPANAVPAVGVDGLKAAAAEASTVTTARWERRCWHDGLGRRHCRRVFVEAPYYYGPGVYYGGGRHHHYRGHGFTGGRTLHGGRGFRGFGGGHGFRGGHHGGGHHGGGRHH